MIPVGSWICESGWMRKGIEVRLSPGDRERLEAVIGSGNSPQKACVAGSDCAAERRWDRHDGDPAADRQRQADDLALAGALHGRRCRWAAPRCDAPWRQATVDAG